MSVRTAASACSREGLGVTPSGAARTWSDRVGSSAADDLGQGLTTASIAVSPFGFEAGGVTGAAASVIRALGGFDPCATTGRRIPILHGFGRRLRSRAEPAAGSQAFLLAPAGRSLYIPSRDARNRVAASSTVIEAHVERGLQQPNSRAGREYSPARPPRQSRRHRDRPFQALRLDRYRRPQDGRRH